MTRNRRSRDLGLGGPLVHWSKYSPENIKSHICPQIREGALAMGLCRGSLRPSKGESIPKMESETMMKMRALMNETMLLTVMVILIKGYLKQAPAFY